MRMTDFTIHDEKVVMTRKVLQIEQYRDERACALASKHFLTGLKEMFTSVFAAMIEKGLLKNDDPEMLALAYTAPISVLIHQCDRNPEEIPEMMAQIETFARHFVKTYGRDD